MRRRGREDRGAVAVEMAAVTPLLAMLLVGVIQLGVMYNNQQELTGAAREAGRLAIHEDTTLDEIRTMVADSIVDDNVSVTVTPNQTQPCDQRAGQQIKIEIDRASTITLLFITDRSYTLSAEATFLCAS